MAYSSICIIGMGLLGGSLGMALKQRGLARRVVGVARRPEALERARELGSIDEGGLDATAAVAGADLTFLCVPVLAITRLLPLLAPHVRAGGVVTDVGSTKTAIVDAGESVLPGRFLGGHPMAGSEQAGIEGADPLLFEGATWALTPGEASAPVEPLSELITGLGARPLLLPPEEHDRAVAATSHLPHATAAALARVVADALGEAEAAARLAAGSYRDTTRVAASSPELWRDVCLTNREPILAALGRMQGYLAELAEALRQDDVVAVERFFRQGREAKARMESARRKG
ncbi:MAG TPA: prephenate dehydrogenase [Armatimonadota bacterium]|nr:prephenate dehydrogenase [Armatimonadota bacterium]HPT98303.1 prephenate dehydrogenase [Armatimonadota bacterium]